jgi:VanZ family protein
VVPGPLGLHFVPISLAEAWGRMAAIHFANTGSDQRADWMANLIMLIPLGYLTHGALSREGDAVSRVAITVLAILSVLLFVFAVKFLQLFFPPRTVTLNYLVAQSLGALIGIGLFGFVGVRLYPALQRLARSGDGLLVLLGLYTVFLIAYFLAPFDFVIGAGDWNARLAKLPLILRSAPGEGQPTIFRVLIIVADTLATAPVGMFLSVAFRKRSFWLNLLVGFGLMALVEGMSLLVMGASPFAVALLYRTVGIGLGLFFMDRLKGRDLRKRHYYFSQFVPAAFLVYLLVLSFVSGLWTSEWVTLDQAVNSLEARQFLPFWNYYIVSKAQAVRSLVAHAFIFAPVGMMIWVRRGFWSKGRGFSAFLAFTFSLLVEIGRWFKPGFRPDFSDPLIAAAAAALAFRSMPTLWRMFEREATMSAPVDLYVAKLRRAAENPVALPTAIVPAAIIPAAIATAAVTHTTTG